MEIPEFPSAPITFWLEEKSPSRESLIVILIFLLDMRITRITAQTTATATRNIMRNSIGRTASQLQDFTFTYLAYESKFTN